MKLSEVKKELGGKGKLVWIEPEYNEDGFSLVFHPNSEVKYGYDPDRMYAFEKFIDCDDYNSLVLNTLKNIFGVSKVFVFQETACGTDSIDKDKFTKLGENRTHEFYDSDCSYLVVVPKSVSGSIPDTVAELIKVF